jgi:hypothetical protein
MADVEEKKIILSTEAKTDQSATQLNALTNVIDHVSGAVLKLMQVNLQLTQSNINVRNSIWAVIDSKLAYQRLAIQQVELDRQQAQLNVKMAERQALITMRTGRRLDVEMALLNTQMASRDANLTLFDIEMQRWNLQKQAITAQEQENMALKQQRLLVATLAVQLGALIVQTGIMITLLWQRFAAETALLSLKTLGVGLGVAAASVAGALAITKMATPPPPKMGNPPSSGTTYNSSYESNFNVNGSMDTSTYLFAKDRERDSLQIRGGRRTRSAF